jgi:hypothetical protein
MVVDADRIYLAGRYNAVNFLIGGQGLLAPAPLWTLEHLTKTPGIPPLLLALVILFSLLAWVCSASFAR